MDAMSDAIEGSDVMLYGVSKLYKESANVRWQSIVLVHVASFLARPHSSICMFVQCRLEANYAHQQELDMIPLLMQEDYQPKGWRESHFRVSRFYKIIVMSFTRENGCRSGLDYGDAHVVRHVGRREGR